MHGELTVDKDAHVRRHEKINIQMKYEIEMCKNI